MTDPTYAARAAQWWIDQIIRRRVLVLVLGLIVTALSGWQALKLEIDSDLRALLAPEHEVVKAITQIEEDFHAVGSVNVLVAGGSQEVRHAFADAIAQDLAEEPLLDSVDHRLEGGDFFVEHALYYLSDEEMEELSERLAAWQHAELCTAAPDICLEDPDTEAGTKLQAFINEKRHSADERSQFTDYYERDGIEALVVFLRPTESSAELDYAVEVVNRMREALAEVHARDGPWRGTDMRYNVVGPYVVKANEHVVIARDMVRSGLAALAGVVLVLYILFRSWRAVLTLLVPLICGVAWALGLTELWLGHLNIVTSMISSIIMGMGIDAGIHFLARARRERLHYDTKESVRRAFGGLIRPLLIASLTTISAFIVMASSNFVGFREFGIIAASGVGLCLFSMVTIYPALLASVGIKKPTYRVRKWRGGRLVLSRPLVVFGIIIALSIAAVSGVGEMRDHGFDRNTRNLGSDWTRTLNRDIALIRDIFGRDIHASVLRVEGWEELDRVYAQAQERHAERVADGTTWISELVAAPALMPSSDQRSRKQALEVLTEDWSERTWARLEGRAPKDEPAEPSGGGWDDPLDFEAADTGGDELDFAPAEGDKDEGGEPAIIGDDDEPPGLKIDPKDGERLSKMLRAQPFSHEDLPEEAVGMLRADDGAWGVFAYPNYDPADIFYGVEFMRESEAYTGGTEGMYAGEPTVYATLYVTLQQEWPTIIGLAALSIALMVLWQVRGPLRMLLTLAPLVLGSWWLFGVLGTVDIKLTLLSVPILPALLGIGVDNGVYLMSGILRSGSGRKDLHRAVDDVTRAIFAATMTTCAGFAAFLIADSAGLRGIGSVAVIGLLTVALAALLAIPAGASLIQAYQARKRTK